MANVSVNRLRRQKGSAMIEGALVFVAFMFIILGAVEFGRLVFTYSYVVEAAQEGARYSSLHTGGDPTAVVKHWAVGFDSTQVVVATTCTPSCAVGNTVKVKVSYPFTAIVGGLAPASMTAASQSTLVILK